MYIKSYYGGIYKLNTDPFDGSVEFVHNISSGQGMFTFSADGQYILTNDNGSIKKYDFSTGQLVESLTLNSGGQNGIANGKTTTSGLIATQFLPMMSRVII